MFNKLILSGTLNHEHVSKGTLLGVECCWSSTVVSFDMDLENRHSWNTCMLVCKVILSIAVDCTHLWDWLLIYFLTSSACFLEILICRMRGR